MSRIPDSRPPLADRFGALFLSRPPTLAIIEALALAGLLSLGVLFSADGRASQTTMLQAMVIGPLSVMLAAGRMRLVPGRLAVNVRADALAVTVLVALITIVTTAVVVSDAGATTPLQLMVFSFFLVVWNAGAFAFFRMLAYLWPTWEHMRRSRLRWAMTHTIMMVVAPMLMVMTLLFLLTILTGPGGFVLGTSPSTLRNLMALLPLIGILIFLTVVALGVLLPPAALASYVAAKNTAARLETLSHGTSGLSSGDFGVRVRVDGEDEIATVQRDFNLMAGTLERSITDLRNERDNVERLLKTQQELVASVSHELRTPVATMRGYLESALDEDRQRDPAALRDDLRIMSDEIVRLQRLIDDLFILTRTDAGQLPLDIRPTQVAPIVSRSVAAVAETAWRTGRVEVIEEIQPGLPPVLADGGRLEQVIRNLLSNAVRHTPPGGIVAVSASAGDDTVTIDVKDTGQGIAPEHLEGIFERFARLDDARQHDPAGAGLGLAIVKDLTAAMGGKVAVQSEPGSGSCFSIHLRQAPERD